MIEYYGHNFIEDYIDNYLIYKCKTCSLSYYEVHFMCITCSNYNIISCNEQIIKKLLE